VFLSPATQRQGAPVARIVAIGLVASIGVLFGIAVGRGQAPSQANPILPGSTIEYIPPLAQAVLTGDPKQVSEALKEAPDSINEQVRSKKGGRAGFTPLILAAALSETEIATMLIERGAKITVLDDYNRSAIWYAALRGDVPVTEALVYSPSIGEVVNVADSDFKRTPLHIAVRSNQPKVVSLLIKAGASEKQKDILGETPIDYCNHALTEACKQLR